MQSLYFKLAFRVLRKNPLLSLINIFSLAFGVAACTLIFLFIKEEKSFDSFHSQKDNIYRINEIQSFTGTNTQHVALSMAGMGPNMTKDYPEVLDYTRFIPQGKNLIQRGDQRFTVEELVVVDSNFIEFFNFPIVAGDPTTALDDPNSIVITKPIAEKYFPGQDAINETLEVEEDTYTITCVVEVPENSHLQFDVLVSLNATLREYPDFNNQFGNNFLNTYLRMDPQADIDAYNAKMPDFISQYMNNGSDDANEYYKFYLQKLEDVHLASTHIEHDYKNYRKFNGAYLNVFIIIGIIILLIASVNFMNLITARSSHRFKEIGVRKTVGALKSQLFNQFVVESVLLSFIAFAIGMLIVVAALPLVNNWMGRTLSFFTLLQNPLLIIGSLVVTLGLGFLSGIYPAMYMASFKTIKILKGENVKTPKSLFRNSLIVLQFGLAIAMIISTILVMQQLSYIENRDIGFEKDHIVLVDMNQEANQAFETMKEELLKSSNIKGVTASGQRLGNNFHQWGFKLRTDSIQGLTPSNINIDYDYFDVYGIKFKQGRGFSKEYSTDNGLAFVINEKFAEEIGIEDPIGVAAGHAWYPDDSLGTIIGVTENFNFNSLHYEVNTLAMVVHPDWGYSELSVKVNGENITAGINEIERIWTQMVPSWPFEYSFLDEHFDTLYKSDQQMKAVIFAMAMLAIFIACMGLFGLAAITMEKRVKEIGIRKILGASVGQIAVQLSKVFGILIIIAFVLFSIPTWLFVRKWLENFAYRIDINPLIFILGFIIAFVIALLTISYHTLRLARKNPVDSLRYE
ncbi:MAG: FtsX-like permease family protein [Bacteroidota bacterium]